MLIQDPTKSLHVLKEEIRERPKDALKLIVVILIEGVVNALAFIDIVFKKQHTVWAIAESTKKLQRSILK